MDVIVVALISLKFLVLFVIAWNRRFVMDEFQQFGWAKYIPGQISYLAAHHPKAEGYAFFFYPAHLIGWNAWSMLLAGRMEMALLACGTLTMVYGIARTLGENRLRALAIVVILMSFSNFIERIFETRGDPLAVFFATAALLVAVRGRDRSWWNLAAGLLSGLAFLATQKSLYFDVALGIALVGDAWSRRQWIPGMRRSALLVAGWAIAVTFYCLIVGGKHPVTVWHNLIFGPEAVMSPRIAAEYGGLRRYVVQTLTRNVLLYLFCVAGLVIATARIARLDGPSRIALIFTWVIATLVFAHDQPWPYVFVMALPFMALWALRPLDVLAERSRYLPATQAMFAVAVAASFVRNVEVLRIDNHVQLALIDHAEAELGPNDRYFDGVGMLPNRLEPSTLWLDRHTILTMMSDGRKSELYRILAQAPPKLIIWSYRMDAIEPLIGPLIGDSYVQIAPNLRIAGRRLQADRPIPFVVPVAGTYGTYNEAGRSISQRLLLDGKPVQTPLRLARGWRTVAIPAGSRSVLLLPQGTYTGRLIRGRDNPALFDDVYN